MHRLWAESQKTEQRKGSFILAFPTERNESSLAETFSLKIHFRSESITAILRKETDGNLQPNRSERKFLFCWLKLCRLPSVPPKEASSATASTIPTSPTDNNNLR
uniref:Uncharacterized protein n=1 Tax=Romanomermis culicivorax TaxID=13658 RepID=A0A915IS62_ROMCU